MIFPSVGYKGKGETNNEDLWGAGKAREKGKWGDKGNKGAWGSEKGLDPWSGGKGWDYWSGSAGWAGGNGGGEGGGGEDRGEMMKAIQAITESMKKLSTKEDLKNAIKEAIEPVQIKVSKIMVPLFAGLSHYEYIRFLRARVSTVASSMPL